MVKLSRQGCRVPSSALRQPATTTKSPLATKRTTTSTYIINCVSIKVIVWVTFFTVALVRTFHITSHLTDGSSEVLSLKSVFLIRVLLSGSDSFSWVRIRISKKSGSWSMKKRPQNWERKKFYIIFSTLNTLLFWSGSSITSSKSIM